MEHDHLHKRRIASVLLYIASMVTVAFGILYLTRNDIMDYHHAFLGMTTGQLDYLNPRLVPLYLALMKIAGGALLSIGVTAFIIVAVPFSKGEKWAWWSLLTLFTIMLSATLYVTITISCQIPAGQPKPPWLLTLMILIAVLLALINSFIPSSVYERMFQSKSE